MYGQGAQNPSIQIHHFVQWAFFPAIVKVFCAQKLARWRWTLLKNGLLDGYAYSGALPETRNEGG